jgi:ribonuclease BN (tRNA processing enzyme)
VRVESAAGRSLAYLPDHAPHLLGPGEGGVGVLHEAALHLARDVDLLIHDAHFTRDELAERPHYGHSCAEYATELAAAAGARRVLLFHHEPRRSDDHVEAIAADIRARCDRPVDPATEGMVIQL